MRHAFVHSTPSNLLSTQLHTFYRVFGTGAALAKLKSVMGCCYAAGAERGGVAPGLHCTTKIHPT